MRLVKDGMGWVRLGGVNWLGVGGVGEGWGGKWVLNLSI